MGFIGKVCLGLAEIFFALESHSPFILFIGYLYGTLCKTYAATQSRDSYL